MNYSKRSIMKALLNREHKDSLENDNNELNLLELALLNGWDEAS